MGENLTNDALRLLWDVIRDADVALDNVMVDVYDRDTGTDGFYGLGDDMPEDDGRDPRRPLRRAQGRRLA